MSVDVLGPGVHRKEFEVSLPKGLVMTLHALTSCSNRSEAGCDVRSDELHGGHDRMED